MQILHAESGKIMRTKTEHGSWLMRGTKTYRMHSVQGPWAPARLVYPGRSNHKEKKNTKKKKYIRNIKIRI